MKKTDDFKIIEDKETGEQYFISPQDHADFIKIMEAMINSYNFATKKAVKAREKRIKDIQSKTKKKRPAERDNG